MGENEMDKKGDRTAVADPIQLLEGFPMSSGGVVEIPIKEWELMNRRIGYLEGAIEGVNHVDNVAEWADRVLERYAQIVGEGKE